MASIFYTGLSRDLSLILNDADDFNVIIQVGENNNTKEFRAHTVILRARSSYFKSALSNDWIVKNNDIIMFHKPNITPTVFSMILKYIYTGELDLTKQSSEDILGLLIASDELLFEELFNHVQDHLIEQQTSWIQKNFVLILHTVFKLASCKKLQDYSLKIICEDPQPFFSSKNFLLLDKNILYDLLKRDDLQINEAVTWNCLIKWGIEQTSGLKNELNRAKWNNKNYRALRKTLKNFIPLIRFSAISPADFFERVRPYKDIVPNQIYEEIEKFYYTGALPKTTLLPRTGSVPNIESNIIKAKLFSIIIKWINGRDYEFNLIYRKSPDINEKNNIRSIFAGHGSILILIKVKDSKKIFGGYNPVGWQINTNNSYDRYLSSTDSFIFSFENNEDTENKKISYVTKPSRAILDIFSSDGVIFGGYDLWLDNDSLTITHGDFYENYLDEGEYEVKEIEAFSVVKK